MFKRLAVGAALAAALLAAAAGFHAARVVPVATAYVAKLVCSGVFVSDRDARSVFESDVATDDLEWLRRVDFRVDAARRQVSASLFGLGTRVAAFTDRRGCTLVDDRFPQSAGPAVAHGPMLPNALDAPAEPGGSVAAAQLAAALDAAFLERDAARRARTRAIVIVHEGRVIAERYAEGYGKDTPLIGWSMAKSAVNALVGALVREGRIAVRNRVPVPEWQGDARREITWHHLLSMTSGLEFGEAYTSPLADVIYMLLGVPDAGAFAAAKPLEAPPGTRWSYASGTTNIVSRAMRAVLGEADYRDLPRRALFDRIGMRSAVIESDASGTLVGSSFMYASARDWARLGLLYLRDGVWAGERVLPEGWVAYSRWAAAEPSGGRFGAHFWTAVPESYRCSSSPALPADAFHAIGHEGQFVTIVPSRDLVVVRLGRARHRCAWDHQRFVNDVLSAIGKPAS